MRTLLIHALYNLGYNEGLERAAKHCEYVATLARTNGNPDCAEEIMYARWRAEEIRNLKTERSEQDVLSKTIHLSKTIQ